MTSFEYLLHNVAIIIRPHEDMVRFQVLAAASMKMMAVWDIAPCTLVEVDRCFRDAYYLHHQDNGGGSKHLYNVGQLPEYKFTTIGCLANIPKSKL
jgi:hypothetical protein